MRCAYYDAGVCRSCTSMGTPYADQLAAKHAQVQELVPAEAWLPPYASAESGFRNRAKMVVGGEPGDIRLGILDDSGSVADLRHCGLYESALARILPSVAEFVSRAGLRPYDVRARSGELKYVHVTVSPDAEFMVRFVLRSEGQLGRLHRHLPDLVDLVPGVRVVSVNLLPEHKAVLEGDVERPLTHETALPMRLGEVTLWLRPRSFFQTNTAVARALYDQAHEWVTEMLTHPATDLAEPRTGHPDVLDLYSGVGGFALHLAAPARRVVGVELSADAVESARRSAADRPGETVFEAADATAYALALQPDEVPGVVVVNPPRRGVGPQLAAWLERSGVPTVLYSSCNPHTLARDLAAMPSLRPVRARVFDMFPQTEHCEVLALLRRVSE